MENVPAPRQELDETARRHVAIARQLLVETDGLDYTELSAQDLCRLVGRLEVVVAMLILTVEGGDQ
ncbi:hypothetical protein [Streptomyces sp. NPDC001507]|uniref:hypothetical protein n=1 Tax=Streptomyces sp. NPDC001507 TaxID=3364579 RepID=UPI00369131FB